MTKKSWLGKQDGKDTCFGCLTSTKISKQRLYEVQLCEVCIAYLKGL